jgi:molecular chaperone DnaK (HSP70)
LNIPANFNATKTSIMKIAFLTLSIFSYSIIFSQSIRVKEINLSTSKGSQNALSIEIPHVDEKYFQSSLKNFLKDWGKCKENDGEYSVILGEWKDYGKKTFDVYARYEPSKYSNLNVSFAIDLGGAFLNSKDHSSQFELFQKSIESFGRTCASNYINDQLEKENKFLKSLEKEQKNLEEEKSEMEREIEEFKARIEENKAKIEQNKLKQEKQSEVIKEQVLKIQEVNKKKKDIY